MTSLRQKFDEEAGALLRQEIERLRTGLTFEAASALPRAQSRDVVVAGREVQLTIFRQSEMELLEGGVLVTVQVARFGLGGTSTLRVERGLVFFADGTSREASDNELARSGQ